MLGAVLIFVGVGSVALALLLWLWQPGPGFPMGHVLVACILGLALALAGCTQKQAVAVRDTAGFLLLGTPAPWVAQAGTPEEPEGCREGMEGAPCIIADTCLAVGGPRCDCVGAREVLDEEGEVVGFEAGRCESLDPRLGIAGEEK